jgi:hypothetical protein
MKLFRLLALAACLFIAAPITFTGCSTPRTHEAKVYDTFRSTWDAAYTAYSSYCELIVKCRVSAENEAKADAAWNKFRTGFMLSFHTASSDWNAITPEDARKLADAFILFINSL